MLKLAGGAYLLFLGIRTFRQRGSLAVAMSAPAAQPSDGRSFAEGLTVGVSNPKTLIFLAAILPQFVSRSSGHLATRLDDMDPDGRCEALIALARLGDPRARERVDRLLATDDLLSYALELGAAAALADARWHPRIEQLRDRWKGDDDFGYWKPRLDLAIARCDPDEHRLAREVERLLSAALATRIASTDLHATMTGAYPLTRLVIADGNLIVKLDEPIWSPVNWPQIYMSTAASTAGSRPSARRNRVDERHATTVSLRRQHNQHRQPRRTAGPGPSVEKRRLAHRSGGGNVTAKPR